MFILPTLCNTTLCVIYCLACLSLDFGIAYISNFSESDNIFEYFEELTFAMATQGTDEAIELGFSGQRVMAIAPWAVFEQVSLGLEVMRATDYDRRYGERDESTNTITLQVESEF